MRDSKGKFARRRIGTSFMIVTGVVALLLGHPYLIQVLTATTTVTAENKTVTVEIDRTPESIDELKTDVVAELEACESGGYPADKGIIIFDTNNKASIGVLQMQKNHVIHFQKTLYGKDITGQEAVVIAITPTLARALAKRVLFEVEDGWKEWYNCGKKLDLGIKIGYIQQLENAIYGDAK